MLLLALAFSNCVQKAQPKTITIMVDMNTIKNPSKVGIRGNGPLSWEKTTLLKDTDGDGIYEETFDIYSVRHNVEFKFINNNDEFELQDQNNRIINFEYKPETITYKAIFNNSEDVIITKK